MDAALPPGTVCGEYVVEAIIGTGGFGAVYRGVHPLIGKQVAIKVLDLRHSADPSMVSRFVSEARAVNKIRHGSIVDIFSFGVLPDGRHFYIMELLDGMTLEAYLRQRGKLEVSEALELLAPIGSALDAAHAAGIAHRDLKPANIFLVRDGEKWRPKLLDFGVAKLMVEAEPRAHRTGTGISLGTPDYMAPEQCRGTKVDHRADIYAFGVVAYEMLSGRRPFSGETAFEVMTAHVSASPPVLASVPPPVSQAVMPMLAKRPEDRPPSLRAALAGIEGAASGASLPAVTSSPPPSAQQRPAAVLAETVHARSVPQAAETPPQSTSQLDVAPRGRPWAAIVLGVLIGSAALAAAYSLGERDRPSSGAGAGAGLPSRERVQEHLPVQERLPPPQAELRATTGTSAASQTGADSPAVPEQPALQPAPHTAGPASKVKVKPAAKPASPRPEADPDEVPGRRPNDLEPWQ